MSELLLKSAGLRFLLEWLSISGVWLDVDWVWGGNVWFLVAFQRFLPNGIKLLAANAFLEAPVGLTSV